MSITEKYNFKVSVNQFKHPVNFNFWDETEELLINSFEQICLNLKEKNKSSYTMIELGSNQCYYSLLFKHILGKDKTLNIMIEPYADNFNLGKSQFELNNCDGIFYNKGIGNKWGALNLEFDTPSITLNEILQENKLDKIDIIQCDIDCSELYMLNSNSNFFEEHKTEFLFLGTHSIELHNECKKRLLEFNYNIILDHPIFNVGCDALIIAKNYSN